MKKIKLLTFFFCVVMLPFEGFSTTRNVPTTYSTIQAGINASVNDDTVLVAPGTYYEHLNLNGKNIVLCSNYLTTGDPAYISSTIIDGSNTDRVITINQDENSSCQIVGFTIQNGNAIGNNGGGIYIELASPQISHCIIQNNIAAGGGGGLTIGGDEGSGGSNNHTKVTNCIIRNNTAGSSGGGVLMANCSSNAEIINCIISGNTNTCSTCTFNGGGGGVNIYHRGKLENCLITNNSAPNAPVGGGGVYCDWGTFYGSQGIFITGCTIANNTALNWGGTNYVINGGEFRNCIIWGNTDQYGNISNYNGSSFVNCCTSPLPAGIGNISSNPNFINPTSNNFRLSGGSPCINTGNNVYNNQTVDLDGNPRIMENTIDIGCYEYGTGILKIVTHVPSKYAVNVLPNSNISITFDHQINQATLSNNIRVHGLQTGLHTGIFSYNSGTRTVTIDPIKIFTSGEVVEVIVTQNVKSITGDSLIIPYVWRFNVNVDSAATTYHLSDTLHQQSPWCAVLSELNNDNRLDASCTNHNHVSVEIYKNDSLEIYKRMRPLTGNGLSPGTYDAVSADFDNDGFMDMAIAAWYNSSFGKVNIWHNNGNPASDSIEFDSVQQVNVTPSPKYLATGDFNGDGFLDMVVGSVSTSNENYDILLNDGVGRFVVSQTLHFNHGGWGNVRQCIVDYDSDGDLDIIGGPTCTNNNYLMINNGFGVFIQSEISLGLARLGAFQSGDFDGDGDVDLIGSRSHLYSQGEIGLLKNSANGTSWIWSHIGYAGDPSHCYKVVKDFDADGDLDFAVANDNKIDFYKNDGAGNFTFFHTISPALRGSDVFDVGDIDNDGDLDMIVPNGYYPLSLSIYKANNALSIIVQPISQSKCIGTSVTFHCKAFGENIQYSWYKNNNLIQGPNTDTTYIINSVISENAGDYKCVVRDTVSNDSITSNIATLYVAGTSPTITSQPVCAINVEGKSATFNITATGYPALFYKWYKNNIYIPGDSTHNYYSIIAISIQDTGTYYCIVSNGCGFLSSDTVSLSVIQRIDSLVIKCTGDDMSVSARVFGPSSYSYQWIKRGVPPLTGEEDSTFSIINLVAGDAGFYQCQIIDNCGAIDTTNSIELIVNTSSPIITNTSGCGLKLEGKSMNFNTTASGSSPIFYQWLLDGNIVPDANNNSYIIDKVTANDAGKYRCVGYNPCGSDTSIILPLSVIDSIPILITSCVGDSASFIAHVHGPNIYSYQWYKEGEPPLAGGNDSIYIIDPVSALHSGNYFCIVTDSCGSDSTNLMNFVANSFIPTIATQPLCALHREGRDEALLVTASGIGTRPYSYQWLKHGAVLPLQRDSVLKMDSLLIGDAGEYRCIVSNACGSDTSNIATVSIIKTIPETLKICLNDELQLQSIVIPLVGDNTYQWRKDGSDLLDETDSIFYKPAVAFSDSGYYSCVISNACGQDTTNRVHVEVGDYTEWYGYSMDWFNTGNWSCGIPTSVKNALLPELPIGGFWPWLNPNDVAECKGLIIEPNVLLTLDSGAVLEIHDTLKNSGMVNCAGVIKALTGSVIMTGDNLVLESYGSLMHGLGTPDGGGDVIGKIRVNKRGWTGFTYNFWSSPVKNANTELLTNLYETFKFDPGKAHNDTIYPDNAFQDGWVIWRNKPMTPGIGYATPGADFVTFYDTVNDGTISVDVYNYGFWGNDGWNLVGNPYPSGISAVAFITDPENYATLVNKAVYLWTDDWSSGSDYNNSLADFTTINELGVITPSWDPNCIVPPNPDTIISSCQGFEIRTSPDAGLIRFTNSMRRNANNVFYKESGEIFPSLKLGILAPEQLLERHKYNEIIIAFKEDATEGIDLTYDAIKRIGNSNIALYSFIGNEKYCMQALPIDISNKHIPLGLLAGKEGFYSFTLKNVENFPPQTKIILEDKFNNSFTNLLQTPVCDFSISQTGYINDRFVLHFNPTFGIDEINNQNDLIIYSYNKSVIINNTNSFDGTVYIYNTLGQINYSGILKNGINTIYVDFIPGIYLVKVVTSKKSYTKKLFIF